MNNHEPKQKSDILCTSGTTKTQIQQLLDNGVTTIEKIAYETGANTGCGGCDYLIHELIIQHRKQNSIKEEKLNVAKAL